MQETQRSKCRKPNYVPYAFFLTHSKFLKACLFATMIHCLSLSAGDPTSVCLFRIPPSNLVAYVVGYEIRSTVFANVEVPLFTSKPDKGRDEKGALFYVLYPTNFCGNFFWIDNDFVPGRDGFGKPSPISDWYEQGKCYLFLVSSNSLDATRSDASFKNIVNIHSFFRMDKPIHMYKEMQGIPDEFFLSRAEINNFIKETDEEISRIKGLLMELKKTIDDLRKNSEVNGQFASGKEKYDAMMKTRESLLKELNRLVGKNNIAKEQLSTIWRDFTDRCSSSNDANENKVKTKNKTSLFLQTLDSTADESKRIDAAQNLYSMLKSNQNNSVINSSNATEILHYLKDRNDGVRYWTALSLSFFSPYSSEIVPELLQSLEDRVGDYSSLSSSDAILFTLNKFDPSWRKRTDVPKKVLDRWPKD